MNTMESPRISLARVLELGVRVSWREAVAIVHEAVARTAATEGAGPARVTAESCLLTRGGDVVLTGTAAQARPEAVVRLLDDLLASCSNPGRFSGAVADGTALDMIEELRQRHHAQTPPGGGGVGRPSGTGGRGRRRPRDGGRRRAGPIGGLRRFHRRAHASSVADGLAAAVGHGMPPRPRRFRISTIRRSHWLGDSAVGDAEVRRPGLDHEDSVAAAEAAREWTALKDLPSAMLRQSAVRPGSGAATHRRSTG